MTCGRLRWLKLKKLKNSRHKFAKLKRYFFIFYLLILILFLFLFLFLFCFFVFVEFKALICMQITLSCDVCTDATFTLTGARQT
jgi:hypothetical protein